MGAPGLGTERGTLGTVLCLRGKLPGCLVQGPASS